MGGVSIYVNIKTQRKYETAKTITTFHYGMFVTVNFTCRHQETRRRILYIVDFANAQNAQTNKSNRTGQEELGECLCREIFIFVQRQILYVFLIKYTYIQMKIYFNEFNLRRVHCKIYRNQQGGFKL